MRDQLSANYNWFRRQLPALLVTHRGQHALLHEESVASYHASSLDAIKAGIERYGEGGFSVEPVDDVIEDLGFYSHVGSTLQA